MADWAYPTVAAARSSGDPWSNGDVIHTGTTRSFRYFSSVLEADGLLPLFPVGVGYGVVTGATRIGGFLGGQHPVIDAGCTEVAATPTYTYDTTTPGFTRINASDSNGRVVLSPTDNSSYVVDESHHTLVAVHDTFTLSPGSFKYWYSYGMPPEPGLQTRRPHYIAYNSNQTYARYGGMLSTGSLGEYDLSYEWTKSVLEQTGMTMWHVVGQHGSSVTIADRSDRHIQPPSKNNRNYMDWVAFTGSVYHRVISLPATPTWRHYTMLMSIATTGYTMDYVSKGWGVYKLSLSRFGRTAEWGWQTSL